MAHYLVDFTIARKFLKDVVVGLICLHTEIIFHGGIKPWSMVQYGIPWKLTDLKHSSRKIGNVNCNAEKYNWGCCPPEVAVTLLNSEKTHNFSGLHTYDLWSLVCIIYHLIFGYPLCNIDSQQINSLLSVFIYHCFHFFKMFVLLPLDFLGISKNYENIRK